MAVTARFDFASSVAPVRFRQNPYHSPLQQRERKSSIFVNVPSFSTTYVPVPCAISPLNPCFRPLPAFLLPKSCSFNTITLTHSTHRNFQVSPWKSSFEPFRSRDCGKVLILSRGKREQNA